MVMVIPPVNGVRDGTAVPDRSDGRSRLLVATRTNHPNSETGRAAVNVPLEGLGRRRLATSRDSKSGRTNQHSRSYFGPAIKRWIPREVSMNGVATRDTQTTGLNLSAQYA